MDGFSSSDVGNIGTHVVAQTQNTNQWDKILTEVKVCTLWD